MDLEQVETVAIEIAREGGALLHQGFRQAKQVAYKSTAIDLVTEYDTAAERLIVGKLKDAFPGHAIRAEEGAVEKGEGAYTWYIDPLDGTNNFVHGFPMFAVSLALYEEGRPLVGVVYDPTREETFHARDGGGAYVSTRGEKPRRLAVSATDELVGALLATGFPYDRHHSPRDNLAPFGAFLKRAQGLRRTGAAALDLAYVAAGRLDGFWEFKLNSWDVAAGILLVHQAGGRITDCAGQPLPLLPQVDLVASNGHIHEAMVTVLAEAQQDPGNRVASTAPAGS